MKRQLTRAEEQIMQVLWDLESATVKEIIKHLTKTNPAYNTVSTIIRILERKKFVSHKIIGRVHEYYPLIKRTDYSNQSVHSIIDKYFGGSFQNMVSFFVNNNDVNIKELGDVMEIINQQKSKK